MKTYITFYCVLTLFFAGTQIAISKALEEIREQATLSTDSAIEMAFLLHVKN
jgi:hypothetical protein